MKFTILVPVWRRYETLKLFNTCIERLKEDYDIEVVAVGSEPGDKQICEALNYNYVQAPNNPLGGKLNYGLKACKRLESDAVLMLGSDDILSSNVMLYYIQQLKKGFDFVGFLDCYFMNLETKDMIYWKGYRGQRAGEPIGAWRCLSRNLLNRLNWEAWDNQHHSVDYTMWNKLKGVKKHVTRCKDKFLLVDLKTSENVTKFRKFDNSEIVHTKTVLNDYLPKQEIFKILNYGK